MEVRERLGLQALGRVDEQDRALAGLERARNLVGEVDVAGGVDQVQLVPVVGEPDGLGLDRDPALPLQVHPIQVLGPHVAVRHGVGELEQTVGQRGLAVVDMGHDAEVPDVRDVHEAFLAEAPHATGGQAWPGGKNPLVDCPAHGEHQVSDQAEQTEREAR